MMGWRARYRWTLRWAVAAPVVGVLGNVAGDQIYAGGTLHWPWLVLGAAAGGATAVIPAAVERRVERPLHADRPMRRYETRYRRLMLRTGGGRGALVNVAEQPRTDAVHVDVPLAKSAAIDVSNDPLGGAYEQHQRNGPDGECLLTDLVGREERAAIALVGAPGTGKSTMLRHLVRTLCEADRPRWGRRGGPRRPIPVLLRLHEHAAAIAARPRIGLEACVRDSLGDDDARRMPDEWLVRRLEAGECVVLLDGLDEIADPERRHEVARWVEHQMDLYRDCDFVVTSRPPGYLEAPVDGVRTYRPLPLSEERVRRLVRAWYLAAERDERADGAEARADRATERLLANLELNPGLRALAVNPLLLTMMIYVQRFRGGLPDARADLYGEICTGLLWRWRDEGVVRGERLDQALSAVAFRMMVERRTQLGAARLREIVAAQLRQYAERLDEDDVVREFLASGLMVETRAGGCAFAHLTLQEYLAAGYVRDDPAQIRELRRHVGESWWWETILLYTAQAPAGPILERALKLRTDAALALALDIDEQGARLPEELRARFRTWIGEALAQRSGDGRLAVSLRALSRGRSGSGRLDRIADALLVGWSGADRLGWLFGALRGGRSGGELRARVVRALLAKDLDRYADASGVCLRSVRWLLYQPFLDDCAARGEPRAPDAGRPAAPAPVPHDDPGAVVTGVRAGDARAFVAWANAMCETPRYRLPTAGELHAAGAAMHGDPLERGVWAQGPSQGKHLRVTYDETPALCTTEGILATAHEHIHAACADFPDLAVCLTALRWLGVDAVLRRAEEREANPHRLMMLRRARMKALWATQAASKGDLPKGRSSADIRAEFKELCRDLADRMPPSLALTLDRVDDEAHSYGLHRAMEDAERREAELARRIVEIAGPDPSENERRRAEALIEREPLGRSVAELTARVAEEIGVQMFGHALGRALAVPSGWDRARELHGAFGDELEKRLAASVAELDRPDADDPLEDLAALLASARRHANVLDTPEADGSTRWAAGVVGRLAGRSERIRSRAALPAPDVSDLFLGAVCVAVGVAELADELRHRSDSITGGRTRALRRAGDLPDIERDLVRIAAGAALLADRRTAAEELVIARIRTPDESR
ncbi:NACHT domain-containing protein [Actinomadura gamaensis]|uniref:NACHT domain-containing protein n=1 Tax=Actinomadura gamaensis TaxID=1763541 RepID=A0ABV9TYH2_9ACTN